MPSNSFLKQLLNKHSGSSRLHFIFLGTSSRALNGPLTRALQPHLNIEKISLQHGRRWIVLFSTSSVCPTHTKAPCVGSFHLTKKMELSLPTICFSNLDQRHINPICEGPSLSFLSISTFIRFFFFFLSFFSVQGCTKAFTYPTKWLEEESLKKINTTDF